MGALKEGTLLDRTAREAVPRLRLGSRRGGRGLSGAEHSGGGSGMGTRFAEHRRYTRGEDVRYLDWNVLGRLGEAYVKRFEREEAGRLLLLLDATASMAGPSWETARRAAALVGAVALREGYQVEVSLLPPAPHGSRVFQGRRAAGALERWVGDLRPGTRAPLGRALAAALRVRSPGNVVVWISDLAAPDAADLLRRLRLGAWELLVIQVVPPPPAVGGPAEVVDPESGTRLGVDPARAEAYGQARVDFLAAVAETARRLEVPLARLEAGWTAGRLFLPALRRGGVVR